MKVERILGIWVMVLGTCSAGSAVATSSFSTPSDTGGADLEQTSFPQVIPAYSAFLASSDEATQAGNTDSGADSDSDAESEDQPANDEQESAQEQSQQDNDTEDQPANDEPEPADSSEPAEAPENTPPESTEQQAAQQPDGSALPPPQLAPAPPPPRKVRFKRRRKARVDEPLLIRDGFRFRGGYNLIAGLAVLPERPLTGPAFGMDARLGAQFNHILSLSYQATVAGDLMYDNNDIEGTAGFQLYNTFLPMITLFHSFDIGAGPSLDFVAAGVCSAATMYCGGTSTWNWGGHARFAVNVGGLAGGGPRRSGFSITAELHPTFLTSQNPAVMALMTVGVGAEWY